MIKDAYTRSSLVNSKIDKLTKERALIEKEITGLQAKKDAELKKEQDKFYNYLWKNLTNIRSEFGCELYRYFGDYEDLGRTLVDDLSDKNTATELPYDFEDIIQKAVGGVDDDIDESTTMKKILIKFLSKLKKEKMRI